MTGLINVTIIKRENNNQGKQCYVHRYFFPSPQHLYPNTNSNLHLLVFPFHFLLCYIIRVSTIPSPLSWSFYLFRFKVSLFAIWSSSLSGHEFSFLSLSRRFPSPPPISSCSQLRHLFVSDVVFVLSFSLHHAYTHPSYVTSLTSYSYTLIDIFYLVYCM